MRQKCETKENIEGGQGNNVNPFHAGLSSKRDPRRFFRGAEWPDARRSEISMPLLFIFR